jgi:D-alanine-D-alanine ligase
VKAVAPKIGVLMGGRSAERDISLRTGEAVYNALKTLNHPAVKIDVGYDVVERIKEEGIDLAFLALHGKYGEDGSIQGLLEMIGIPYTGSGILASSLAMNKIATKKMLSYAGLPTPSFMEVESAAAKRSGLQAAAESINSKMGLPLVVKAPTQGSTIGITFVHRKEELVSALEMAYRYDHTALVEQFIEGTEITASVLGNENPVALPLIEIVSMTGVYDYEAKYTAGMSEHIIPPRISSELQDAIKALAVRTFKTLGCRGLARVDFMIDHQGNPFILEVNTIPGMTATSLFPDAARAAGIEFPELIDRIVKLALES